MRWLIVLVVLGCGPSKPPSGTGSAGNDSPAAGTPCDGVRAKVAELYRAEARARAPKPVDGTALPFGSAAGRGQAPSVDEEVADNTAMVMTDCLAAPAKVAACIAAVATVAELEARCLAPLDDEGTEGDRLAR